MRVATLQRSSAVSFNPFKTIWIRPRETIRAVIVEEPTRHVLLLTCLFGISDALDRAATRNLGDRAPTAMILILACIIGPLGGLFSFWMFSHLLRWSGRWIGGVGTREQIKAALAWASVPTICTLPLWIPELFLFGSDLFTKETPRLDAQPRLQIAHMVFSLVELALGIWAIVLLCRTLAEVQGFRSAWKGFGNFALAAGLIVIPLLAVIFLSGAASKS